MSEKVDPQKIDSLIGSIQTLVEGYVSQARLFDTLDLELSAVEVNEDGRYGLRIDDQSGATMMLLFPNDDEWAKTQGLFTAGLSHMLRAWVNRKLDEAAAEEEAADA
jgi:hypothetical protein